MDVFNSPGSGPYSLDDVKAMPVRACINPRRFVVSFVDLHGSVSTVSVERADKGVFHPL
jgi:hypothetical protein